MKTLVAPARACALLMALIFMLPAIQFQSAAYAIAASQDVTPAGALSELAIDDGAAECILGPASSLMGKPGFGWANKLTPAAYPATLRSITIGFSRNVTDHAVRRDSLFRIVVFIDPEKDGPGNGQTPDATFIGRVRDDFQTIQTFSLVTPLTIQDGSFVVGAIDEFGVADFPALYDVPGKSTPAGSDSFTTFSAGVFWQKFSDATFPGASFCEHPGSFLIRATVETGAVEAIQITKIQDPLAVEPWDVVAGLGMTVVANYVSDNLTVIKTLDNSIQNVPLGDGPGGAPDGPFGIVAGSFPAGGNLVEFKAYVTLFGSNTIPSKEFPVDYSTVGPGRVVELTLGPNNTLAPAVTINVGKGPRFPAVAFAGGIRKLYVPCGGANRVDVIDTSRNAKIAEIPVGIDPSSCVASINGQKMYVTNFGDGSISVIDTKTDQKIKDIPAPRVTVPSSVGSNDPPATPRLTNPWRGAVSMANGNLYVTYWGAEGDAFPNGSIATFDTCKDEFVRASLDFATRGTPAGAAGATGLPAPAAPLAIDPDTGKTPGAGGGGGGPFGIAPCDTNSLAFTNDALGIAGLLDPRTDQVVTAPPIALASCPKPRGISCLNQAGGRTAFIACGQPDNSVILVKTPAITQSVSGLPVIESIQIGSKIKITGSGFTPEMTLQFIPLDSSSCLTFARPLKIKKQGKLIEQKGNLSDGAKPKNRAGFLRVIASDGTVQLLGPF
jgi:YVTN family beta-propeller protein